MSSQLTPTRGDSKFTRIEVMERDGRDIALKHPLFPLTEIAEKGFEYFKELSEEHPVLHDHFPPTDIEEDHDEKLFAQEVVHTLPGFENMASDTDPAVFDITQIEKPEDIVEILDIFDGCLEIFERSVHDKSSGLQDGVGWFPEAHKPDSYVKGDTNTGRSSIYIVDCHPILPVTIDEATPVIEGFYDRLDGISRELFGKGLEKLFPRRDVAEQTTRALGTLGLAA